MSKPKTTNRPCIMCNRPEGVETRLPNGLYRNVCPRCQNDRWQMEEARKRSEGK